MVIMFYSTSGKYIFICCNTLALTMIWKYNFMNNEFTQFV